MKKTDATGAIGEGWCAASRVSKWRSETETCLSSRAEIFVGR
jgi:hypothetical protein